MPKKKAPKKKFSPASLKALPALIREMALTACTQKQRRQLKPLLTTLQGHIDAYLKRRAVIDAAIPTANKLRRKFVEYYPDKSHFKILKFVNRVVRHGANADKAGESMLEEIHAAQSHDGPLDPEWPRACAAFFEKAAGIFGSAVRFYRETFRPNLTRWIKKAKADEEREDYRMYEESSYPAQHAWERANPGKPYYLYHAPYGRYVNGRWRGRQQTRYLEDA